MPDSMSTEIGVVHRTEISTVDKSTEQLTAEINAEYRQAEQLAGMSAMMLAQAGKKLIEIKERVGHGRFGEWCDNNLDFGHDKAAQMMKLAKKMEDENSIFSNFRTFGNIGISRVWALLAAPEEVAAQVVKTQDVTDMTVRELKEEISRLKSERNQIESREADMRQEIVSLQGRLAASVTEEDYENLQKRLEFERKEHEKNLSEEIAKREAAEAEVQKKLEKAKDDLRKAKDKIKKSDNDRQLEIQKSIEEVRPEIEKKAKEDALAEVSATLGNNAEEITRLENEVERLEAEKAKLSNTNIMVFKVLCDELQDIFEKISNVIEEQNEKDPLIGEKMMTGMKTITERWTS